MPAATPSQTVGPYFTLGLFASQADELVEPSASGAVRVTGRVLDGAGEPVPDAMVEIWQADEEGRYRDDFGWGRSGCDADGRFSFTTVKPGRVGEADAPHVVVMVFARGLLRAVLTRMYFPDEEEANAAIRSSPVSTTARRSSRGRWTAGTSSTCASRATSKRSSSPSEMFDRLFVPADARDALGDFAWLAAMLEVEAALARAEAAAGVIPDEAGEAIGAACRPESFDPAAIADEGRSPGNPVEPLVRALREAVGGDAAEYVHLGATSQDILDTAAMLVSSRVLGLILERLEVVAEECARLADAHRATPMVGRTLLQQAEAVTFGLKAAGWLVAVLEARTALVRVRDERLAVQLGGAAGTVAPLGDERSRGAPAVRGRARAGRAGRALAHEPDANRRARLGACDHGGRRRKDRAGHRADEPERGR